MIINYYYDNCYNNLIVFEVLKISFLFSVQFFGYDNVFKVLQSF